jgi:hypothetical protein
MHTPWFATLSMFVAVNTVLYLTLAIIKLLPKAYLSDWVDQRNRRTESRSIYPMSRPELGDNWRSPARCPLDVPPTDQCPFLQGLGTRTQSEPSQCTTSVCGTIPSSAPPR